MENFSSPAVVKAISSVSNSLGTDFVSELTEWTNTIKEANKLTTLSIDLFILFFPSYIF